MSCGARLRTVLQSSQFRPAVQVLRDAELRTAYDKQLEGRGHKSGVFISNEVCKQPMTCLTDCVHDA